MIPTSSPMGIQNRLRFFLLCIFLPFLSNGCAWLVAVPQSDPAAEQHLARLAEHNKALHEFKGLFRVRVQDKTQTLNIRAALAAAVPDHLRVELLNPIGQPLLSVAGDGDHVMVLSIADQKFYRLKQSATVLEPFIHVPLGIEGLLDTLSGRPPLPKYSAAQALMESDGKVTILLKNRWHNLLADMQLDVTGRLQRLRYFNSDATLQFEIDWLTWRPIEKHLMPIQICVSAGGGGERVTWSLERLWTDVALPPSTFVLEPPVRSDKP